MSTRLSWTTKPPLNEHHNNFNNFYKGSGYWGSCSAGAVTVIGHRSAGCGCLPNIANPKLVATLSIFCNHNRQPEMRDGKGRETTTPLCAIPCTSHWGLRTQLFNSILYTIWQTGDCSLLHGPDCCILYAVLYCVALSWLLLAVLYSVALSWLLHTMQSLTLTRCPSEDAARGDFCQLLSRNKKSPCIGLLCFASSGAAEK